MEASHTAMRPPSRPRSATEGKSKDTDNINNNRQYREKQKVRQQPYFSQMNQSEYQDIPKGRTRDGRERKQQRLEQNTSQGYGSPNYKTEKNQHFHILVSMHVLIRYFLSYQFQRKS